MILGAFIFLVFYSLNPHETFSAQGATRKEVITKSTSYVDDEGIEQNITDTTTTHYFISNGAKDYSTTNRTRTYTDNEEAVHTFTNYQDRYGGWSDEEEIINEDTKEIIKDDNTSGDKFTYRVRKTEIVPPTYTQILLQEKLKKELVLFTCYPVGTTRERFVVWAELIENEVVARK